MALADYSHDAATDERVKLHLVVEPAEETSVDFGPILIRSITVAGLAMLLGVGLPMWALTGNIWDGIGLGLFTAFWGGPGFGTMAAGALWSWRLERATPPSTSH